MKYETFASLQIGQPFIWFNPFFHALPNRNQEVKIKISPRKYKDSDGTIWHSSGKTGVCSRIEETS